MFKKEDQIGPYTLIEKLGKGAFGEVWLAEEKTAISAHKFALKLPNEEDVDLEAIRQEADVWENVKGHPNILPIIKADIFDGQIYIASEYAPGGSLNEWLKNHGGKAPSTEIAVDMIRGILTGLEHLHSKGVIHRDIKPGNILLQADTPRIADFGIARLAKAATANSTLSAGTPAYMAPECFYSVRSEQTDIWAVGVLFHKILSGLLPFSRPDQVSVMNAILNDEPTIEPTIPAALQQIIRKALQKDTSERYKTAAEMLEDVNKYSLAVMAEEISAQPAPIPPTPTPPVVAPVFEREEEETLVRRKQHKPKPKIVYVEPAADSSPNYFKTVAIALVALLVAGAVVVWAALNFGGNSAESNSSFSNTSNQLNRNSNLTIESGSLENRRNGLEPITEQNIYSNSGGQIAPVPNSDGTSFRENSEIPSSTNPYQVQSDVPASNVNIQPRTTTVESPTPPAADGDGSVPNPLKTPLASQKTPPPIEIDPEATPPSTLPRRGVTKPTPSKATPDDTPPPMTTMKESNPQGN